jgi:hypothetical protein
MPRKYLGSLSTPEEKDRVFGPLAVCRNGPLKKVHKLNL